MFEAYSVGIRLKLVDMVTPALGLIGRGMKNLSGDVNAAQKSVADLESRLQRLKQMGLVGGALAGVGFAGLSLFEAPIKAAREYELAFTKFKTLNLGDAVNKQADQFARGANLMGISAKELMTTMSESVGLFGSYGEAQKLAPKIAALNQANSAIFHGKIDGIDEGSARAVMKFIDRRGGTKDEATFLHNLDLAQKMVTGSGGSIKYRDLDQFSQQGGTAFRGLSDDGIYNMAMLLQEQGGSRAGTSFMSLYQNLIAGRTPKKTMALLQDFGLGHLGMETHATVGGKVLKSLVMKDIKDGDLLQANPTEWFRRDFLPALVAKGITSDAGILKATNDLISTRTGSNQGSIMSTQLMQIMRDANLAKNAMGYDQTINTWKADPNSKFSDLHARWTDTLRELGTAVLPAAIKGVEGLTSILRTATSLASQFPTLTKGLALTSAALFGLAGAGGTLMLFRAGLGGLGLILGAGATAGGVGLLGSVTALLGPIGLLAAALGGLVVIANLLKPDSKDDPHPGQHWVAGGGRSGAGGHWEGNTRIVGARTSNVHTEEWNGSQFVRSGGASGGKNTHITLKVGERVLAQIVADQWGREVRRPQTGLSDFDSRMHLTPAGGH